MNHQDTIMLLKECDEGIQMGILSIEEMIEDIKDHQLLEILGQSIQKHKNLQEEIEKQLHVYHQSTQQPQPLAKTMSWLHTNVKLMTAKLRKWSSMDVIWASSLCIVI